jgi:hypothetical protein
VVKIKKLGLFSYAKFHAVIFAFIGLFAGIVYSFGGLIYDVFISVGWGSSTSAGTPGLSFGTVLAFGALIGMPIIFAAVGYLTGLIEASLYNVFSGWFGGIDLDIEQ